MPPTTATGDISYRTAGYVSGELLKRAQPLIVLSRFGQQKPIPRNHGTEIKFRGYLPLDNDPKPLLEGVTPAASTPTFRDVVSRLQQYGDYIEITDVLSDTHEDPLWAEFSDILGEQAAIMLERVIINKLLAGTNVFFAGQTGGIQATTRGGVNEPLTLTMQRRVTRALKRQEARPITSVVSASANYSTFPIAPSYIAVCHTDVEADIRNMPGFVPVEKYGSYRPVSEGEIGSVENVRYVTTNLMEPWLSEGAAPQAGLPVESSDGACADVYPILFLGKNAFGVTPFAADKKTGASPVNIMALNPNTPRGGDPLGQRGSLGWKAYRTAEILYDMWMARVEVAVTRL
ncbi:N4-gp56 family major capsid protein [uncultured Desulfovibrio sp.]|uniref:N4-gp56 family major capsid protein n=1 Tax=uncultured Desulfovibrio sp. TaxID=167968 RepID=UPI00260BB0DC|nr:N4-gp56 family major capsid protein [uncultured Desulfovibrio sp.]